ncbi:Acyl-CoA thioesterase Tes3p, putative [Candida dubliniensis CD36]|uniref:Acyl-CoA thioesterase Tes3p, putative n=1 Tax=Candida dubliniensis (strain CD36 / ATCC MYA-646 / CBS 7987 / NCPF 3949 / NRRL Y-17841) TaxID=573826 RepID=B9WBP8_CANDC|nr:Acyl-CoA thioesterase Tes3p, putative [Candida dubliniensis CD36]CAX43819.1 Acyl-CoA thioesterase Tes3p, putative [Candida dubliniensis CD36]
MREEYQANNSHVELINLDEVYGVTKIGHNTYRGNRPLTKPDRRSRGVYGGNFCGQAVLVAMKSSPPEFKPHSFHSYFVKAGRDDEPVTWKVEEVSTGRTFANRLLQAIQFGNIVFTAEVSLTKKNSISKTKSAENKPPISFETPIGKTFEAYNNVSLPIIPNDSVLIDYRQFPEQLDSDKISYSLKWGNNNQNSWDMLHANKDYQFVGLAILSDILDVSVFLKHLGYQGKPQFNASLDHSVYFHDDDFDVTKWCTTFMKVSRICNDRALIKAEIYSNNGSHIASIVQERLWITGGAKL